MGPGLLTYPFNSRRTRHDHEENVSTQQQKAEENSRLPGPDEHQRRAEGRQSPAPERQEENCRLMKETLGPRERIRKKTDFSYIYKKGIRLRGTYFSLIYLPRPSGLSRLGVVASRKVGMAVVRNRIKRWMRDAFRRNKKLLGRPLDVVVVAKNGIGSLSRTEFDKLFFAAVGAIKEQETSS